MAWFRFNKKEVLQVSEEKLYGQQWAKVAGEPSLTLQKLPKIKVASRAGEVALFYDELRLVAVMPCPTQAPAGLVRRLLEALPAVNKGRYLALPEVNGAWLEQLSTRLHPFYLNLPTGQLLVFLDPQLYSQEPSLLNGFMLSVINHPLPYYLLAPRMKQGYKVVSFKASSLQYSTNWQEPMSALLEVTVNYQGVTACYYVAVAQATQRGEVWQKVIPVLIMQAARHTKACWKIELTSRWIEPTSEVYKGFIYEGVVRYSDPYEAKVSLIIPTMVLQLWVKALSTPAQRKEMLPTGSTVIMLFHWVSALCGQAETLKPLWRCAVSGSYAPLTGMKGQVSVPEILRIIDEKDAKLVLENLLLARHSQQLNALLCYEEKGEKKSGGRWAVPDWFKKDFTQHLPVVLRGEWEQQKPSLSLSEWQEFNGQVMTELLEVVAQGRLELSIGTLRVLQQLVIEPQLHNAKEVFEQQFQHFYAKVWSPLLAKKRSFMVQKLNNRQWAQILACRPQFLLELYPHVSRRRALYMEEELSYLQHALKPDYAGARHSLALLNQYK